MNIELLLIFIILNAVNVILQTIKSLCVVKGGKILAASMNAIAYGFYTVVIVYMVCDLPLFWKVVVISTCNFIGVYIVKYFEEKRRKEKLWKVEATVKKDKAFKFSKDLNNFDIPFNSIASTGQWTIFNIYCSTQKQSRMVREIADSNEAKYFVSETKNL